MLDICISNKYTAYVFQINIRQQRVKFQRIKFIKTEVQEHLHPLLTAIQTPALKPLAS